MSAAVPRTHNKEQWVASMSQQKFARRHPLVQSDSASITIEGQKVVAGRHDTVSAAMLAAGVNHTRHTEKSGSKRAPYCQMGICFECLVEIDGKPNQQACLVTVKDGMRVKLQNGLRQVTSEEITVAEQGENPK